MNRRRCVRCGNTFVPGQRYYRYCKSCHNSTRPVGRTYNTQRINAPDRHHGGTSSLRNDRRSVILHGHKTREAILEGLKTFLTDLYQRPAGLSTLLTQAGMTGEQITALNGDAQLNGLVMDFCPALRDWLIRSLGNRAAELLIEHYGLYGDKPASLHSLVSALGFADERHAQNYLRKMLGLLREPEQQQELEQVAAETGRRNLPVGS